MEWDLQRNSKKETFHLQSIKGVLLDSLNLTTAPQTITIINFVVSPHITATTDRVHVSGMTAQISYTWTRMARNSFVQYRFCVYFMYQTKKPVAYWKVIILVDCMP